MMGPTLENSDAASLFSGRPAPFVPADMNSRNGTSVEPVDDTVAVEWLVRRHAMPKARPVPMPTQEIRFWTLRSVLRSLTAALTGHARH
jgi:hypothetical protein